MVSIYKFKQFLDSAIASILPQDMIDEIGWKYFSEFNAHYIPQDDLEKMSRYFIYLKLKYENDVVLLESMPSLQIVILLQFKYNVRLPESMPSLQALYLNCNNITILPKSMPSLRILNLGYNNKIDRLPESMPYLRIIDLGNNTNFDKNELVAKYPSIQSINIHGRYLWDSRTAKLKAQIQAASHPT